MSFLRFNITTPLGPAEARAFRDDVIQALRPLGVDWDCTVSGTNVYLRHNPENTEDARHSAEVADALAAYDAGKFDHMHAVGGPGGCAVCQQIRDAAIHETGA